MMAGRDSDEAARKGGSAGRAARSALDEQLRELFGSYGREPVPDHIMKLVDQLDRSFLDRAADGGARETSRTGGRKRCKE